MDENQYDTRYKSPAMRARREPTGENPMEQPEKKVTPEKQASGILSADAFGGTPPKVGEKYTIEVKEIDPESREAEVMVVGVSEPEKPAETPMNEPAESEMT